MSHMIKFYENAESSGVFDDKEENIYTWLFPNYVIGRAKD